MKKFLKWIYEKIRTNWLEIKLISLCLTAISIPLLLATLFGMILILLELPFILLAVVYMVYKLEGN